MFMVVSILYFPLTFGITDFKLSLTGCKSLQHLSQTQEELIFQAVFFACRPKLYIPSTINIDLIQGVATLKASFWGIDH